MGSRCIRGSRGEGVLDWIVKGYGELQHPYPPQPPRLPVACHDAMLLMLPFPGHGSVLLDEIYAVAPSSDAARHLADALPMQMYANPRAETPPLRLCYFVTRACPRGLKCVHGVANPRVLDLPGHGSVLLLRTWSLSGCSYRGGDSVSRNPVLPRTYAGTKTTFFFLVEWLGYSF